MPRVTSVDVLADGEWGPSAYDFIVEWADGSVFVTGEAGSRGETVVAALPGCSERVKLAVAALFDPAGDDGPPAEASGLDLSEPSQMAKLLTDLIKEPPPRRRSRKG